MTQFGVLLFAAGPVYNNPSMLHRSDNAFSYRFSWLF